MPPKPTIDARVELRTAREKVSAIQDALSDLRYLKKTQCMDEVETKGHRAMYRDAAAILMKYKIWVPPQSALRDAAIL